MTKQHAQDLFLTVTAIAVVVYGVIVLHEWDTYSQARDDHRGMFVTNDHVTNLHHELVKDKK